MIIFNKKNIYEIIFNYFIFLISDKCFCQTELKAFLAKDICNCFDSVGKLNKISVENFTSCFKASVENNATLIVRKAKKNYGDNWGKDSNFIKFTFSTYENMTIDLVSSCDAYFKFTDSLRYDELNTINLDSIKLLLIDKDKIPESKWDNTLYGERGLLNFYLKRYTNALKNFDKA